MSDDDKSLQERYAPHNACFGCGPANDKGLRLRSFKFGDEVVATWTPQKMHEAFEGVLNGGIVGTLLDCHCNWTAAEHLRSLGNLKTPPCTVTASYSIVLKRPCPTHEPVELHAQVRSVDGSRCEVEGSLIADGKVRATCIGVFVAVEEGHPAFHRW
jgi:acyl-coenzyme A thioesterase PaaI-like protein